MSLDGTLQLLSLPNLIQLHCNQQQTVLVRLVRPPREGLLAFAKGELIYASLGALTGEEALYELLGWDEGEFHVSEVDSVPEPNISTPWSVLLLEGLRQVDEARAARQSALQALLAESKERRELRDAVIVGENGLVLADIANGRSEQSTALVAFVAGRAQLLGIALGAGEFNQLVYAQAEEKGIIERTGSSVLGCWLEPSAGSEPIKHLAQKIRDGDQSQASSAQIEAALYDSGAQR
jgi:predicted regulator of Ras-like GTPase activity (Roadblock/LC7/MglB family)